MSTTVIPPGADAAAPPSPEPTGGSRVRQRVGVFRVVAAPFAWSLAVFNVVVVLWLFLASFRETRAILTDPLGLPKKLHWDNYREAWSFAEFGVGFTNSVILTTTTAISTVLIAAPAAYALTRFGIARSGWLTMFFAIGIGIPNQMLMLPLFVQLDRVGLIDSLFGVWLVYVATSIPFAVFFLSGFFSTLPGSLEEAAALDGASTTRTFTQVMLPQARSALITLLILLVISHWGETFFALVLLQSAENQPLSIAIMNFAQTMQYSGARWAVLFAGLTIVVLPILVVYLWFARRIVSGFTFGSVDR